MKKIYKLLLCAVGATMLFSCVKENFEQPQDNQIPEVNETPDGYEMVEFAATSCDLKTTVDINADGTHGATRWAKGDQLSIFWNGGKGTADLDGEGGETKGKFKGSVPQGVKATHAVYPSSVEASVDGNTVKVTIPAEQPGTFSAGNMSVAEVAEDNSLAFNNVNAFLCVQLVSDEVTKIHVKSVGGHALVGTVPVTFAGGEVEFSAAENTASEVTMTAGVKGYYYISIVPGVTHDGGLLLTYYKGEEVSGTYFFDKNLSVVANKIYNFGEFEPDGNYYVSVEGAGKKNGVSMANAMPVAKMTTLLQKSTADAPALAAVDGAVFHFATGEYELAEEALALTYSATHPVKLTFKAEGEVTFSGNETHSIMAISGADVTMEGITITKSVATETKTGAIKVSGENSKLTLSKCKFIENTVNGTKIFCSGVAVTEGAELVATECEAINNDAYSASVLYINGAEVNVTDTYFEGNWTNDNAGVMLLEGNQESTFTNCEFTSNAAYKHGVIHHANGNTTFTNCTFNKNKVSEKCDGGVFALLSSSEGELTVSGGEISESYAGWGSVVYQENGAAMLTLSDIVIKNNENAGSGAIWSGGQSSITRCTFDGNIAYENDKNYNSGHALTVANGADMNLYGCTIQNHSSDNYITTVMVRGGARLYIGPDSNGNRSLIKNNTTRYGGFVRISQKDSNEKATLELEATTLEGNTGRYGGSIHATFIADVLLSNDVVFKDNYATHGNGGAILYEASGTLACNKCHFEGNHAINEGGAIKVDNANAKIYLNATTFSGNYQHNQESGTTIQIHQANTFAMNNCTIADDTYSLKNNRDTYPRVSWMSFNEPQKLWVSNSTFIGVPRFDGEPTAGGLLRMWLDVNTDVNLVNNIVVNDEQENTWSFCQMDKSWAQGTRASVKLYHTKYCAIENLGGTGDMLTYLENPTSSGFSRSSFGDLTWNADKCYWSWNGVMASGNNKNMITASQFIATLDNALPEFKTWLMSADALYKDQLGNGRGNGAWWPGSYQGDEEILGGDFGNVEIPEYDEEDILSDL